MYIVWLVRWPKFWLVSSLSPVNHKGLKKGLKINFNLCPSYSFHKSLDHKSPFLETQLKVYPHFPTTNQEKQPCIFCSLFIFRGHSTRDLHQLSVTMSRVTYFIMWAHTGTGVTHSQQTKSSGEVWKKYRWLGRRGRNKQGKNSPAVGIACMAIHGSAPGVNGRTFELWVLNRWA